MMVAAITDLADINTWLDTTESYIGSPYIYGQYNLVVLPAPFPWLGMSNPMLSYVSPAVITSNKQLVY